MGGAYTELGDYNKSIECYQKAIELDPKYAVPGIIWEPPIIIWATTQKPWNAYGRL